MNESITPWDRDEILTMRRALIELRDREEIACAQARRYGDNQTREAIWRHICRIEGILEVLSPSDRLEAECHGYDLDGNPVGPQYDYEGEAVDIAVFIRDNEIIHPDDLADIRNLKVGEELRYGGGAAPITVLRRVR